MQPNLLTNRRLEIEKELDRLKQAIAAYEEELGEIETAERIIARYSGAERYTPSASNQPEAPKDAGASAATQPFVPEMIRIVLGEAYRRGLPGLEPAQMYDAMIAKGWTVNKDTIRTRSWRMWKDKKLDKPEDSAVYSLPKDKPAGGESGDETPAGLMSNPEHGREAGQGGGT
ncbi:hypothetical protein [Oricola sp.]|uniref:hypothetical protein n=1 Tax=Oricola sp. TaxID=1979950 RepID=UPI003511DC9A